MSTDIIGLSSISESLLLFLQRFYTKVAKVMGHSGTSLRELMEFTKAVAAQ